MKKIEIDNRFIGHAAQMYGVTPFEYTDGVCDMFDSCSGENVSTEDLINN